MSKLDIKASSGAEAGSSAPGLSASTSTATSSRTPQLKRYKPYFSPREIDRLSAKQRGKLSVAREERGRQQACGFIDAVGVRCGL